MMMRKLLVLALVLSVAGLANAGLSTTILVTDKLSAVVDTDAQTITFVGLAPLANAAGAITGLSLNMVLDTTDALAYVSSHSGIGLMGTGFEENVGDWVAFSAVNTSGVIGNLVTYSYAGSPTTATLFNHMDWGASEVSLRGDTSNTNLDGMVITIPEPMTMLLLGLGGLFLRKKK